MRKRLEIVEQKDANFGRSEKTGVYVGPRGDSRFYKAGDLLPPGYTFSHLQGAPLTKENQQARAQQVTEYQQKRAKRIDEARVLTQAAAR